MKCKLKKQHTTDIKKCASGSHVSLSDWLGTPQEIELNIITMKIFKIIDTYYEEAQAKQIRALMIEFINKEFESFKQGQ